MQRKRTIRSRHIVKWIHLTSVDHSWFAIHGYRSSKPDYVQVYSATFRCISHSIPFFIDKKHII